MHNVTYRHGALYLKGEGTGSSPKKNLTRKKKKENVTFPNPENLNRGANIIFNSISLLISLILIHTNGGGDSLIIKFFMLFKKSLCPPPPRCYVHEIFKNSGIT